VPFGADERSLTGVRRYDWGLQSIWLYHRLQVNEFLYVGRRKL
jgi:hypothetical protein